MDILQFARFREDDQRHFQLGQVIELDGKDQRQQGHRGTLRSQSREEKQRHLSQVTILMNSCSNTFFK